MKKVLIATTALVATAGMAAAEISISGNARFGLTYTEDQEDAAGRDAEFEIEQRLRFEVRGSATTDNGLEFSARIRAEAGEDVDNSISGGDFGAAEFTVETGGLRLDVGNTSDVTDSGDTFGYYGVAETGFTAFLGQYSNASGPALGAIGGFGAGDADQTTIKLRYNFGDFTISASYSDNENVDTTDVITATTVTDAVTLVETTTVTTDTFVTSAADEEEFQIGVGYSFGDYRIGVNYINLDGAEDDEAIIVGVSGEIGAASFSLLAAEADEQDDTLFGGSINYDIGAATAIQFAASTGGDSDNDTSFGIGFSHSLGGGVTLGGGIGSNASDSIVGDLGVSFSF